MYSIRFRSPHCKKELAIFPSPAGMSLTKLSLGGKKLNFSRPGRVWSVTSRLGTGKRPTLFYSAAETIILNFSRLGVVVQSTPTTNRQHRTKNIQQKEPTTTCNNTRPPTISTQQLTLDNQKQTTINDRNKTTNKTNTQQQIRIKWNCENSLIFLSLIVKLKPTIKKTTML